MAERPLAPGDSLRVVCGPCPLTAGGAGSFSLYTLLVCVALSIALGWWLRDQAASIRIIVRRRPENDYRPVSNAAAGARR